MLFELYQHLRTPCPRPVKEMGYLKELIGMAARGQRCRKAWAPHLQHCRDWIVQAMGDCPIRGKVVVLGSGLLNDVPIDELSQGFERVRLVDILHLPVVKKALKAYENVELVEQDISGLVEPLYRHIKNGVPLEIPAKANIPAEDADLVISLNVLSQLPIIPGIFAGKNNRPLGEDIAQTLIDSHLKALEGLPSRVCLITEVEQRLCQGGDVLETLNPLLDVEIPNSLKTRFESWEWHFAPHPERHPEHDLIYQVEAYRH